MKRIVVLIFLVALSITVVPASWGGFYSGVVCAEEMQAAEVGASGLININKASAEDLATLKGIGPSLAEDIIAYRAENGPFAATEDIQRVQGIGEKKYEAIKNFITVE